MRRCLLILPGVLVALGAAAPPAGAHAQLEGTSPARDATVQRQPRQVVFTFDEPVETAFGAVRIFDAEAARVDDGHTGHPAGRGEAVAVGLKRGLPAGSYTATYRVISADGHPVSGGFVFSVGAPGSGTAASVEQVLGGTGTGPVTRIATAGARACLYAGIAVVVGLLLFLWLCWRPALQSVAGAEGRWRAASEAFSTRALRVGLLAVALGLLGSTASLIAEGASGSASSFWAALDPGVLEEVAGTRTGRVLLGQCLAWLLLAGALGTLSPRRGVALQPAALGADGQALAAPSRLGVFVLALPAALLLLSPALEGHQITQHPVWANLALDVVHVAAIATWLGGIAALLFVVPAATRQLEGAERTQLLAAVLARFSPVALGCVLMVAASGTLAAILELHALRDLLDSGYGRAILVKASLLLVLVGLGAVNRHRVVPRLRALAAGAAEAPGATGRLLRRTLRGELAVLAAVLVATGVLVGSAPPGPGTAAAAAGPFSGRAPIGPHTLAVRVDPARTGPNAVQLSLFDPRTGRPFDGTKELTVTANQRAAGIGPLPVALRRSGPGRYTAAAVTFVPGGTWELTVQDRVSEFDQDDTKLEVKIR